MVEITPNTPQGSLKNYSVTGAILLLIFLETKAFYTKRFCAMRAIIWILITMKNLQPL